VISEIQDWRGPLIRYITSGELSSDPYERKKLKQRACSFTLLEGIFYKRCFNISLIKCLRPIEAQEALAETQDNICGQHLGAKTLTKRFCEQGTYGPPCLRTRRTTLPYAIKAKDMGTCISPLQLNSHH